MAKERKKDKKRSPLLNILISFMFLATGIVVLIWTERLEKILFIIFGCVLLLVGLFNILRFVFLKERKSFDKFRLVCGIAAVAGAVLFLCKIRFALEFTFVVLGIYIIIAAFTEFEEVINTSRETGSEILVPLILTVMEFLSGVLCICGKLIMPDNILRFAGAMLAAYSLFDIAGHFVMISAVKKTAKENK